VEGSEDEPMFKGLKEEFLDKTNGTQPVDKQTFRKACLKFNERSEDLAKTFGRFSFQISHNRT
jgi:hypothetical protein